MNVLVHFSTDVKSDEKHIVHFRDEGELLPGRNVISIGDRWFEVLRVFPVSDLPYEAEIFVQSFDQAKIDSGYFPTRAY